MGDSSLEDEGGTVVASVLLVVAPAVVVAEAVAPAVVVAEVVAPAVPVVLVVLVEEPAVGVVGVAVAAAAAARRNSSGTFCLNRMSFCQCPKDRVVANSKQSVRASRFQNAEPT